MNRWFGGTSDNPSRPSYASLPEDADKVSCGQIRFETGGNTWSEDTRLTRADGESRHTAIGVSRKSVHVIWSDDRDGNTEIF